MNHFPEWAKNLTIYEVNLRQYTPGGTLKEFREHLPRLSALGVGIIWFMPVQPVGILNRKGSLGSYYSIRDYCAIDPAYGTLEEFRQLIDEIHSLGMYCILDWVANHTAWDHHWVGEQPAFYRRNEAGNVFPPFPDWADVVGLDYSNSGMRKAMIEAMLFWLNQTALDGFRCDMAHLVPTDFWEEARPVLEAKRPELFMLAETDHYDLLNKAFHSSYDWKVFHAINEVAQSKIGVPELRATIEDQLQWYPAHASLMRFISNHDENSWQGSELERLAYFLEPMTVLYFTLPGIPLIYSGQEAGNYRRLSFFDKDHIDWKDDKMAVLLNKMALLRKSNPALWSQAGDFGFRLTETTEPLQILAFERIRDRNSVLVFLNLSYNSCKFHVNRPVSGQQFQDMMSGLTTYFGENACMELPPFGYALFVKYGS
jgi:1,4-alpha-glucan branching enzyme